MISVTELRAGATFLDDNQPYQVIKYEHTKMGRGTANIKVKSRNLLTGAVVEKSFLSGNRVEPIEIRRRKMQYLYQDDTVFYFMDPKTFEQVTIDKKILADQADYLKEGLEVIVLFWEDRPLNLELPMAMTFTIADTEPGVRGDSAANIWKEAVLDNGLKVKVPLFIKTGEKIRVDTRSGEYLERVKTEKKH